MNGKKIEKLYPDHAFIPAWYDDWDDTEFQLDIDHQYTNIWMDNGVWFGDDPIDLEWLKEEIDDYFNEQK